jgi:hypothetical protein
MKRLLSAWVLVLAMPGLSAAALAGGRSETVGRVLREVGLAGLNSTITKAQVHEQSRRFRNRVSFERALRTALASFINVPEDVESPLALAYEQVMSDRGLDKCDPGCEAAARQLVVKAMNDRTSRLGLLNPGQKPEGGEEVQDSWIFVLSIESLTGDHIHWAIVDRKGWAKTYNYGFN